jgi:hypothetical protein
MTAENLVEVDGMPEGPDPEDASFLGPLVARLSAEYGLDPSAVRSLAVPLLASFAGARVQAFIPILVEKLLRDRCRGLSGRRRVGMAYDGSMVVVG